MAGASYSAFVAAARGGVPSPATPLVRSIGARAGVFRASSSATPSPASSAPAPAAAAALATSVALVGAALVARLAARRRRSGLAARGRVSTARQAGGFGPQTVFNQKRSEEKQDEISQRVSYLIGENKNGILQQLQQYGYCQIDGFLGGSIHGYPNKMRNQMNNLFNRGWFEQESEAEAIFKIGPYQIENQDRDHRFNSKMLGGAPGDGSEERVEIQFEVAPMVVNFTRSLIPALAKAVRKLTGGISDTVATAEMMVMCGNGARVDRRVSNVFGWNTERGFVPDPRKLVVMYFMNPNWNAGLGGHLQLEGVITPTGQTSIEPLNDRLVCFWADKTVWSMRPSQASLISEHQYTIFATLMAEDHNDVEYDPKVFQHWFPELRDQPMEWNYPKVERPM